MSQLSITIGRCHNLDLRLSVFLVDIFLNLHQLKEIRVGRVRMQVSVSINLGSDIIHVIVVGIAFKDKRRVLVSFDFDI